MSIKKIGITQEELQAMFETAPCGRGKSGVNKAIVEFLTAEKTTGKVITMMTFGKGEGSLHAEPVSRQTIQAACKKLGIKAKSVGATSGFVHTELDKVNDRVLTTIVKF